jgi:cytoskeleton protein RodZ
MSSAPLTDEERLTAGAILSKARRTLGFSVLEVARHLKIAPEQVEALEADAYHALPGRVFVRGFLKNYAKLVRIDPQPLLRSIDGEMSGPELVELRTPSEIVMQEDRARWPLYSALAAFVVVALLAVYEFGFNEPADETVTAPATAPEAAGESSAPSPRNADQQEKPVDPATPSAPTASETVLAHKTAPDSQAAASGAVTERELHMRFDQDSWVEIRDGNNKVIFAKLSRAGRQARVTGTPPFEVTVGNARGVRLKYEDTPIDLAPHTAVTVARLTLR